MRHSKWLSIRIFCPQAKNVHLGKRQPEWSQSRVKLFALHRLRVQLESDTQILESIMLQKHQGCMCHLCRWRSVAAASHYQGNDREPSRMSRSKPGQGVLLAILLILGSNVNITMAGTLESKSSLVTVMNTFQASVLCKLYANTFQAGILCRLYATRNETDQLGGI